MFDEPRKGDAISPDLKNPNRILYILKVLLPYKIRMNVLLIGYILVNRLRNPDTARGSQCLDSGRDIHPVTKHIIVLCHDFPQVNADAQLKFT